MLPRYFGWILVACWGVFTESFSSRASFVRRRHVSCRTPCLSATSYTVAEASSEGVDDDKTAETTTAAASQREVKEEIIPDNTPLVATKERQYDLPWNDLQKWALVDYLPRHTIQVPVGENNIQVITLWRTLSNEVVELSGYPLPFLVERQMELQQDYDDKSSRTVTRTTPTILPYLDQYEFTAAGGLSGTVYGVQGVADGTRIETTPVGDVQVTLPKGFVRTQESVHYELGRHREQSSSSNNVQLQQQDGSVIRNFARSVVTGATQGAKEASQLVESSPPIVDRELMNLGVLTALVISGAAAFETLSHHLTVNVFWV
jgi:hypothetical protein